MGAVGCLVYLLIIAGVMYLCGPFASAYIDFYRYRDAMKQEAQFSLQHTDVEIQARLRIFADSLGLPRNASNVRINRGPGRVVIVGNYTQPVVVPMVGERKVRFTPKAEATF